MISLMAQNQFEIKEAKDCISRDFFFSWDLCFCGIKQAEFWNSVRRQRLTGALFDRILKEKKNVLIWNLDVLVI